MAKLQLNENIFRKYDIRGIADRDLTDDVIDLVSRAFVRYVSRQTGSQKLSLILGRDIRPSSDRIHKTMLAAFLASGVDVIDIGVVTTPVTYFSIVHKKATGGIMITGSHNPPEYNGLKLCIGKGSVFGDEILEIKKIAEAQDFLTGKGSARGFDAIPEYQKYILNAFKFTKRLKVVVDSGNGTAGLVAPKLLKDFGHEVIELFSEPDSRFPNHHPDPTVEENLIDIVKKVKETGADCGLAFDGDADRIGVIDDRGEVIWGDKLMILYSRFILKEKPRAKFIADVKCSRLFFEDVKKHGGEAIMWKTGHAFIKQKLKEEQADLAGEMSGHMFFSNRYFGFDDGIYAAVRVLEILDRSGKKISELLSDVPQTFATPEIRLDCPDEVKFKLVDTVGGYFQGKYPTVSIDGTRIDFGDGWGLIRASNTQPVLVMRFEANTKARLNEIKTLVEDKVNELAKKVV